MYSLKLLQVQMFFSRSGESGFMTSKTLSHLKGDTGFPLRKITIAQALDQAARRWGDQDALVVCHQNIRWSWSKLLVQAETLAKAFIELGLVPGDRIGIWSPNNCQWVTTQFATAKAGLILVNINPAYRLSELEFALNKVKCRALVTAHRFKSSDYIAMLRDLMPEIGSSDPLSSDRVPALEFIIRMGDEKTPGMLNFDDLMKRGKKLDGEKLKVVENSLHADEAINIQFTSGTTGLPKGATLSHYNIINNAAIGAQTLALSDRDKVCIPVPLYHCFGMVMGALCCLMSGATIVLPGEAFEPGEVLDAIETEQCTAIYGVPTMFIAELEHPSFSSRDLSSLRTGIMAGAPCPIEVMKRVANDMGASEMTIAYGMTETSPISFQTERDTPLELRTSTVGTIQPHVEVKIIDSDGTTVPIGTQGELCTRGYLVMRGYWDDEVRTSETIDSEGWMHTGDLATLDEAGYCRITGRLKDMIIRGGENIFPKEIEDFLFAHPCIQDVQAFGVPDARLGEELACWIKLKDGQKVSEDDVREYCKDQIAHYKIPRYVRFVNEFPMTVTGKIQKFEMRKAMMKELGLD